MTDIHAKERDAKGEWQPANLPQPGAVFAWPPRLLPSLKWFVGLFRGFNGFYIVLGVVIWFFLTPSLDRMETFSFDWIALIFLRNLGLLILVAGGLHLRLYIKKRQGKNYKYNNNWLATQSKRFLFNNQTLDNMFWSIASGCTIWTAYEVVTMWAFANGIIPFVDWRDQPVYAVALLLAVIPIREIHFYWTHRLTHWKPIYRSAHYIHHKNINIGPWSGLSMHPIEHLIYLSGILIHWVIPSHPIHAIFHIMHGGLSPAKGHTGFQKAVIRKADESKVERAIRLEAYEHYLHHRHFTVNFGNAVIPLDKWFGTFHDGTPEAQRQMLARRGQKKGTGNNDSMQQAEPA